jgi:putative flavoprotein involved in K+ transport
MPRTEVAILGAGQAGLALSACLAARGIDHVLLERGRIAERWRSERWDSLRLLTPNWMTRLPGHRYAGPDPDGFMGKDAVVDLLEGYAAVNAAPVHAGAAVRSVAADGDGFRIETARTTWRARAVVIATGACDRPQAPGFAAALPKDLHQLTASAYRNPATLPAGGVLVVGAAASGVQIAREIAASGRSVTLAVGRHVHLPRRYRGQDVMRWMDRCGALEDPWRSAPDLAAARRAPSLQITGSGGDVGLAALAQGGVRLVGRAIGVRDGRLQIRPDLAAEVAAAEVRRRRVLDRIDAFIAEARIDAPPDPAAREPQAPPVSAVSALDPRAEGIASVIWATGYGRDYGWLKLPVLDASGELRHEGGVTPWPGLYALGLPFMRRRSSTFLDGVGRDAEAISAEIAAHLATRRLAA